jgi:hypothetical protein
LLAIINPDDPTAAEYVVPGEALSIGEHPGKTKSDCQIPPINAG